LIARAARHPLTWLFAWFLVIPLVMAVVKSTLSLGTEIVVFTLLAIAYNLLMGYTGLVSFGHSAFFGLGAYAAGLVQIHLVKGMLVPLAAGVAAATVAGAVIGFLLMRKRGVYFSLLTLAFTQMFFYAVYGATTLTGGENGLGGIERFPLTLGPLRFDLRDKGVYYYATVVVAATAIWLLWRVVHSPFGRVLQAIRENEQRANFVGYDVRRYKLAAFVVSCAFAGLAGALYTFLLNFAYPELLHVTMAGEIAAMTLVGGMRSFVGPAVGAAVFVFMRDTLSSWTENWLVYFGLIFIAFVMFSPNGIMGVSQRLRGLWRRPEAGPARAEVTAAPTSGPGPTAGAPADGHVLLDVDGVTKYFGGLAAVDGARFHVRRGELHSVIGPNGAGKTTLFNILTGLLPADGGQARFNGGTITGLLPHRIVARGVSRSFQIISVFQALTVFENVRIAVQAKHPWRFAMLVNSAALADVNAEAIRLLGAVGLHDRTGAIAGNLSHGDQRLLEIAIALATRPALLLLDEPLAGLSAPDRVRVADLIRALRRSVTIVLIDHDIDQVLALSDRITVLHQGRVIAEGGPAEIQGNAEVQTAYLGHLKAAAGPVSGRVRIAATPLLRVEGVDAFYGKSHVLHGVSLDVFAGEVVSLLGRNGAGKTTTLAAITGVVHPRRGHIVYRDVDVAGQPPEAIVRLGVGLVPQGRRIFPNLTVLENLQIARRGTGGWTLERVFTTFPKLYQLRQARGATLSGGELQLLSIARALMGNVDLLLLDEPFEGLAPTIVEAVWNVLQAIKGETTLLLVEQNADLALALSDRAYVINNGAIAWTGDAQALATSQGDLRLRLLGV
jgi:ABC-type branched-subunit amino acid transport system ATPase component/ABC-type branched-subunit amino acid transport system permease subunit